MRNLKFSDGGIYHIFNRGVDKREIFDNDADRLRFIYTTFLVNNESPTSNLGRDFSRLNHLIETKFQSVVPVVEILAFVLMPNHFHLAVRQVSEGGVSKFMQKLGLAYTNYFNKRNGRSGALFEATFRAVPVTTDVQLYELFFYIHAANPRALVGDADPLSFVRSYRWSSLPDYLGTGNFPRFTEREFFHREIGDRRKVAAELESWLRANPRPVDIGPS